MLILVISCHPADSCIEMQQAGHAERSDSTHMNTACVGKTCNYISYQWHCHQKWIAKTPTPWLRLPAFGFFLLELFGDFFWLVFWVFFFKILPSTYILRPHLSLAYKGSKKEEGWWTAPLKSVLCHVQVLLLMLPEGLSASRRPIIHSLGRPTAGWATDKLRAGIEFQSFDKEHWFLSHQHEVLAIQPKLLVFLLRVDLALTIIIHKLPKYWSLEQIKK